MTNTTTKATTKAKADTKSKAKADTKSTDEKKKITLSYPVRLTMEIKKSATLTNAISDFNKAYATDSVSKRNAAASALNKVLKEYNKPLLQAATEKAGNYSAVEIIQKGYNTTYIAGRIKPAKGINTLSAVQHFLHFRDCMSKDDWKVFKKLSIQLFCDLYAVKLASLNIKGVESFTKWAKSQYKVDAVNASKAKCKGFNESQVNNLFHTHLASEDINLLMEMFITGLNIDGTLKHIEPTEFSLVLETWAICKVKNIPFSIMLKGKKQGKNPAQVYKAVMEYKEKN